MKFLGKVLFLAACVAAAQSPQTSQPTAAPAAPAADAAQLSALVKQQFGETFTVPAKFPTPLITADFDGDGVRDVAIVADSKNPLPDSYAFCMTCPILTTLILALAIPRFHPLLTPILSIRIIC
jgi:hypothetical protein